MTIDIDDLMNSILSSLDRIDYIKADDIPNIELYMDQVTTFMESRLRSTTRNPGEDKIMTKTMINNYAKDNLLPPPVKKKYSKEHMFVLILIYYFKNVLSINDINSALMPIKERYFDGTEGHNVEDVYESIRKVAETLTDSIKGDLLETYKTACGIFPDAKEDEEEVLTMFSFITLLVLDVYIKKLLIEKLIDGYNMKLSEADGKVKQSGEDGEKKEK
jgi:hypothetical protein